jgi:uncharacterized repeat protein (TIGR01451 family)
MICDMTRRSRQSDAAIAMPDWWRWLIIAGASLILCSCQALPSSKVADIGRHAGRYASDAAQALTPADRMRQGNGQPAPIVPSPTVQRAQQVELLAPGNGEFEVEMIDPGTAIEGWVEPQQDAQHLGGHSAAPWAPPGVSRPWPRDEYLFDGGDAQSGVKVAYDWSVHGLDASDTIGHFDTLDGETVVEPSNRVCIYAPRFAAVRRVNASTHHDKYQQVLKTREGVGPVGQDKFTIAGTLHLPAEAERQVRVGAPTVFRDRTLGMGLENSETTTVFRHKFLPFEDFLVIRRGIFLQSEKARLAERIEAAVAWTDRQAVQIMIEAQKAYESVSPQQAEATYQYDLPPGKPRLRVIKIASRKDALPGETVEFTLRFDNIGDQPIGNVTVIDNLTTRLSYEAESQQCSREAGFFTQENEGESLVLRWEITEPLQPGEGGIIRFKCRVR